MITWIGSPNYTGGRTAPIDRVVIHWMDGTLASTDAVFQDTSRKTSAHYGIEDSQIHQYVKESDTSWHAGVGSMNARSIGIEHSATPNRDASAETLESSAQLIAKIAGEYNIPIDRTHIIKHSEVPYATECSGTIPIDQLVERAAQIKGGTMTQEQAQELSLYIRLLAFESVEQANSHSEDDVKHILADPGYAGAIAKTVYQGEWQVPAWKAGHYDADVKAAQEGAGFKPVSGTVYTKS